MKNTTAALVCKESVGAAWIMCPVCRRGKLLKLSRETRARALILFCRNCKQEVVVEIGPGDGPNALPQVRKAAQYAG